MPPITTTDMALKYQEELKQLDPEVTYLMTLYLGQGLTPEEVHKAAKAGVVGVKSYPKGVTTNSESGIESYEGYYPVFRAMEEANMVLNLHGEIPSDPARDICVLNAEERFLPELEKIHQSFPQLRIVLEHVTSKAAVDKVRSLGPTVGATITVHHLELTIDDVAGRNHHFCKPIAKFPHDREAIREVVKEGHPRFFLGSDSAPHPRHLKECVTACAGVFTTPYILPYLATTLEKLGCLDRLRGFACENGPRFYQLQPQTATVKLTRSLTRTVESEFSYGDGEGAVVPFLAGTSLGWELEFDK